MKAAVAILLTIATGSAIAQEDPEVPRPKGRNNINMEEVRVVGYDLSELKGKLLMGLSGAYLIHEYDETEDVWRFVRTSNETKEK